MKEYVDEHHTGQVVDGVDGPKPSLVGRPAAGVPSGVQVASHPDGPAEGGTANGRPMGTDPLAALGPILATVAEGDRESADLATERAELARNFVDEFAKACADEVRPAMRAVLQRLQQLGGDGLIEEHPGGEARFQKPRIALWMSLKDQIAGEPRLDRYPYLLLEADVSSRTIQVDEGNMWRGAGGNFSGRVGAWEVSKLTYERITKELVAICGQAVGTAS
jgi:hypothetical protein